MVLHLKICLCQSWFMTVNYNNWSKNYSRLVYFKFIILLTMFEFLFWHFHCKGNQRTTILAVASLEEDATRPTQNWANKRKKKKRIKRPKKNHDTQNTARPTQPKEPQGHPPPHTSPCHPLMHIKTIARANKLPSRMPLDHLCEEVIFALDGLEFNVSFKFGTFPF